MNIIKNIFFIILAAFTFASSVGMGVFTHFCHDDGIEQSYIIPQASACEDQHAIIETCCAHEAQVQESDCCSDQMDFFQVDFENFESSNAFTFTSTDCLIFQENIFSNEIASSEVNFSNYANPPPLRTGRQILIQHQVFRI